MEIERLGPSVTVLKLSDGGRILFSYETPVAAYLPELGYVKSGKFFSRTTAQHVAKWLGGIDAATIKHETLLLMTQGAR